VKHYGGGKDAIRAVDRVNIHVAEGTMWGTFAESFIEQSRTCTGTRYKLVHCTGTKSLSGKKLVLVYAAMFT
jgi:hypothetical protein